MKEHRHQSVQGFQRPKAGKCMKMVTWNTCQSSLRRPTWLLRHQYMEVRVSHGAHHSNVPGHCLATLPSVRVEPGGSGSLHIGMSADDMARATRSLREWCPIDYSGRSMFAHKSTSNSEINEGTARTDVWFTQGQTQSKT